jgi:hypothetical protein
MPFPASLSWSSFGDIQHQTMVRSAQHELRQWSVEHACPAEDSVKDDHGFL